MEWRELGRRWRGAGWVEWRELGWEREEVERGGVGGVEGARVGEGGGGEGKGWWSGGC